jgi:transcriptional regulator with XRE-family HTH domain
MSVYAHQHPKRRSNRCENGPPRQIRAEQKGGRVTDLWNDEIASKLDVELGVRVRARRKLLGMSQSALAEQIGITFQQVQKYERGANRISFSALVGISRALRCTISELIEGIEGEPASETPPMRSLGDVMKESNAFDILEAFSKIKSPRLRRTTLQLVRTLAESEEGEAANTPDAKS